jgi:hypothetical protein
LNSSWDAIGLFVLLLGGKEERGDEGGESVDLYTKWRIKSSKSLSEQRESTMRKWIKLEDKRRRRENTFAESRCYSDPCYIKTEEENIERVFIFTGELNRELNDR